VKAWSDYYAYGYVIPGRSFTSEGYRYGFNTQEKVDEIAGSGNHNTALFWEYDTRLGRRWNLDPVFLFSTSQYACLGNIPVYYSDPKGDFKTKFGAAVYRFFHGGKGELIKATSGDRAGEWYVDQEINLKSKSRVKKDFGNEYTISDVEILHKIRFDWKEEKQAIDKAWNSQFARAIIPDYYQFNFGFFTHSLFGMDLDINVTYLFRGQDASLFPYISATVQGSVNILEAEVGVQATAGPGLFLGDPRKMDRGVIDGYTLGVSGDIGLKAPFAMAGVGAEVTGGGQAGFNDEGKLNSITLSGGLGVNMGIGSPATISISGGKGFKAWHISDLFK
jgi:hypothetical protein